MEFEPLDKTIALQGPFRNSSELSIIPHDIHQQIEFASCHGILSPLTQTHKLFFFKIIINKKV